MLRGLLATCFVFVTSLAAPVGNALTITINPPPNTGSFITSRAGSATGGDEQTLLPTTIPSADGHTATNGGTSTHTSYDFSTIELKNVMEHETAGGLSDSTSTGNIYFSVDSDVDYELTGVNSISGNTCDVALTTRLHDRTDVQELYFAQYGIFNSCATMDASLSLGEGNGETGSLTGTLLAGHVYWLYYVVYSRGGPVTPQTLGSGLVRLSFLLEPEPPVPAPSLSPPGIVLLWSLLGLAGWRWLRSQP